jgi:hypothetical protein
MVDSLCAVVVCMRRFVASTPRCPPHRSLLDRVQSRYYNRAWASWRIFRLKWVPLVSKGSGPRELTDWMLEYRSVGCCVCVGRPFFVSYLHPCRSVVWRDRRVAATYSASRCVSVMVQALTVPQASDHDRQQTSLQPLPAHVHPQISPSTAPERHEPRRVTHTQSLGHLGHSAYSAGARRPQDATPKSGAQRDVHVARGRKGPDRRSNMRTSPGRAVPPSSRKVRRGALAIQQRHPLRYVLRRGIVDSALKMFATAVSCGLHTMGGHRWLSVQGSPESVGSSGSDGSFLVPASSAREHHDRQMAWWLAFATDGLVQVVAGLPSALRPELRACIGDVNCGMGPARGITTSLPLPKSVYEAASFFF